MLTGKWRFGYNGAMLAHRSTHLLCLTGSLFLFSARARAQQDDFTIPPPDYPQAYPGYMRGSTDDLAGEITHNATPVREDRPGYVALTFGNPSPSWLGLTGGWQLDPRFAIVGSIGWFRLSDIRVLSGSAGVRLPLLRTWLSPFIGAGATLYSISGEGKFQGLKPTAFALPYINAGLSFDSRSGLHAALGVNFHFPVKLTFPFLELGISFDGP
jgi:hypothetical protein